MSRPRMPEEVKRLKKFLQRKEKIDIGNLFPLLQMAAEAMETRFRWDKRARAHLKPGSQAKGRQLFRESVLEHCYKTGFLAALMTRIEHNAGNTDLDLGRLVLAGLLHDMPELWKGDNYYWEKTEGDEKAEAVGFDALTDGFPPALRDFLRDAYAITQPDHKKPREEWTREQRFFKLIEQVGYFKRALAECRAGNLNFSQVFLFHSKGEFPHDPRSFEDEFPATLAFWFPQEVREEIERFRRNATGGVST